MNDKPKDLIESLVENHRAGKPLLEGATLYRGTTLPDQTQGSFSKDVMHGSLLPQVAAGYTHSWQNSGFIGTYQVDREKTRFYENFSLERHLTGDQVKSYSVADAEKLMAPLVKAVAESRNSSERARAEEKLQSLIKKELYEAPVPTRTAQGEANRPSSLYNYDGQPNTSIRQAVTLQMTKITPQNESVAKAATYRGMRNKALQTIHGMGHQEGRLGTALGNLKDVAQKEYGSHLKAAHDSKPLAQFLDSVSKDAGPEKLARMEKFAVAMAQGVKHQNHDIGGKAVAVAEAVAKIDPGKTTYEDLVKVSGDAVKKFEASAGKQAGAEVASPKTAQPKTAVNAPSMSR